MLQIASGKLFTSPPVRQNDLRGVLHTNLHLSSEKAIETAGGRLLPTDVLSSHPGQLVYEFTELIEGPGSVAGALVSHTIKPYLRDFAAVVSLGFNVTCGIRAEDISRLLGQDLSVGTAFPARSFIPRVFDQEVVAGPDEVDRFVEFVGDLIALKRQSFLAAMRAIRTYVVGLHRLVDDLDLAYTLLVASIESLAQDFDDFQPQWENYEDAKRRKIDAALQAADEHTARDVRSALLEIEHVSLARRFREFSLAHVKKSYFRHETEGVHEPASRDDLEEALQQAYRMRSRYLHGLQEMPRLLGVNAIRWDTIRIDGKTLLTFQGITRLARHVILEFVARQPKVAKESYDYRLERDGIVQVQIDPKYWIGDTKSLQLSDGNKRLEGFLNQVSSYFRGVENATVTDLRPALLKAEKIFSSSSEKKRRPFLALYVLFNEFQSDDKRTPRFQKTKGQYAGELAKPSIEGMVVHLVLQIPPDWSISEYRRAYKAYFHQRNTKMGLRLPRTFEAGISLELAELYRAAGESGEARALLARATESYPGHKPLQDMEQSFDLERTIKWFEIVFPAATVADG